MKIRIPWFKIIQIIGVDLPNFIEAIQEAKEEDSPGGKKVTLDELRDILYDHFLREIIPSIVTEVAAKNRIKNEH